MASVVSRCLDWPCILGLTLAPRVISRCLKNHQSQRTWATLLLAGVVIGGLATAVRSVTGRTRLSAAVTQGWYDPRQKGRWLMRVSAYNETWLPADNPFAESPRHS